MVVNNDIIICIVVIVANHAILISYGVFGCVERKWKERKLRKSMDEFGLTLCPSSSIDFRNFPSFHFLSFKPNKALTNKMKPKKRKNNKKLNEEQL
jgi:hypothetical protein